MTPGSILPAREQLGDLLLTLERPAEALKEYESSLKRAPRRLDGLYGAAQAAKLAGDTEKAKLYFADFAKLTEKGDAARPEIKSARMFAASAAGARP